MKRFQTPPDGGWRPLGHGFPLPFNSCLFVFIGGLTLEEFPKARCSLLTIQLVGGNGHGELFPFWTIRLRLAVVQAQENEARAERSAFVAVDERMILAKIKQVSRSHFGKIVIRRFATEAGLGSRHGGFQKREFAHSVRTAELLNHRGMDFLNHFHRQVETIIGRSAHASFFIVRA